MMMRIQRMDEECLILKIQEQNTELKELSGKIDALDGKYMS